MILNEKEFSKLSKKFPERALYTNLRGKKKKKKKRKEKHVYVYFIFELLENDSDFFKFSKHTKFSEITYA